jgi:hypothetical protein
MRATVHRFHSPDVDLYTFSPGDPEDVGLLVQIMAGPAGGPGEESFDVVVCTPRWLARWTREHGPLMGLYHLVVERYDFRQVRRYLTEAVEKLDAPSWRELA